MTAKFKVFAGRLRCEAKPGSKKIDKSCLDEFWTAIGCGDRRGVYVFGYRAAHGWKPLYVGRTKKQNFRTRITQHLKYSSHFDRMLRNVKSGTPFLFLVARVGKGKSSNSAIDELEIEFINYAFSRNKDLHNDRGIKKPKYVVRGFGGPGKPPKEVSNLKTIIGY